MSSQVYINLPVKDLSKATAFYEALGFTKNPMFSDQNASGLAWSDEIIVMLLTQDFYKKFLKGKSIINAQTTSGVMLALSMESKESVQKFADTAKANGGDYYKAGPEVPEDVMFGYEVTDLDGHVWEPIWMKPNFNPKEQ